LAALKNLPLDKAQELAADPFPPHLLPHNQEAEQPSVREYSVSKKTGDSCNRIVNRRDKDLCAAKQMAESGPHFRFGFTERPPCAIRHKNLRSCRNILGT